MKQTVSIIIFVHIFLAIGFSQSRTSTDTGGVTPQSEAESQIDKGLNPGVESTKEQDEGIRNRIKKKFFNVNLDGTILYGMYHNILTSFYIAQDFEKFTYQLNAGLRRSNDFDYRNSSYYTGEIGFTGKADFTETWEFIPQIEVQNDSYGMFDNPFYNKEEKDIVSVYIKNEYKPTPSRWSFNVGGAQYVHRLNYAQSSRTDTNEFYKITGDIGWEYVWSAANTFQLNALGAYYNYATSDEDDIYCSAEFIWVFKLIEYLKIEPGVFYKWNYDSGHFPSGKISFSTSSIKYISLELSYLYDLVAFEPENYFDTKFFNPDYSLPPGKAHRVNFKSALNFKFSSESKSYLKSLKFRVNFDFEENDSFNNFYPLPENVLTAHAVHGMNINLKSDLVFDFSIYSAGFSIDMRYQYSKYFTDERMTYRPQHEAGIILGLVTRWVDIKWENMYQSSVYIDPWSASKLEWFIAGSAEVQVKVLETFSLYVKVDNLYNAHYSLRDGYPEPGAIFLGGIKIVI